MDRRRLLLPALLLLILIAVACNETTTAPPPPATDKLLVSDVAPHLLPDPTPQIQTQDVDLEALWRGSEKARYETVTQTIDPRIPQAINATFPSWGSRYEFEIVIPAGALPGTRPVEVSLSVPMNNGRAYPPVFRLEPDLVFDEDVNVVVHWPPWLPLPRTYTSVFCLVGPEPGNTTPYAYGLTDLAYCRMDPGAPTKVHFTTRHFSRWGLQNGKMDGH